MGKFVNLFNKSIHFRLSVYFIIILLPLVAISLFSNIKSLHIMKEQKVDQVHNALMSSVNYVDLVLNNVEYLSTLIATDYRINHMLRTTGEKLSAEDVINMSDLLKNISNISNLSQHVADISILHAPSNLLISSQHGGRKLINYEELEWYQLAKDAKGGVVVYIPEETHNITNNIVDSIINEQHITIVRLMDLYHSSLSYNAVAISIPKESLIELSKPLLANNPGQLIFLNEERKIISAFNENQQNEIVPVEKLRGFEYSNRYESIEGTFAIQAKSPSTGWAIIMAQSNKDVFGKVNKIQFFTIAIVVVSMIMALIIAWALKVSITSPLVKLAHGMKEIQEGRLDTTIPNKRKDEFGLITEHFNEMAKKQKHLIQDIYEKELRITKTELKLLQSQINPHFLYNTLDSIYWMAKEHDGEEISEMVLNLSKFFRFSLNKGSETLTVEEIIENLRYYIRIQQIRFMDRFTYHLNIQDQTKHLPLLKIILQPLVENAFIHGIERQTKKGFLSVKTMIESDFLQIEIADNGRGMSNERLLYVKNELARIDLKTLVIEGQEEKKTELFGLRNVKSRLLLYYGKDASLEVKSEDKEGTTIIIKIPLSKL